MASIDCPHRHIWITQISPTLAIGETIVTIHNGICDSCDKCHHEDCEYYDMSPNATRRFKKGVVTAMASLAGQRADELYTESLKLKHGSRVDG